MKECDKKPIQNIVTNFYFYVIGCNQDLNMPSCKTVTWQAFGKLLSPCIERNGLGFGMETILNSVAWTYIYYY